VLPNQPVQSGHAAPLTIKEVRKTDLILMYHSDEHVPSTSPEVYRRMLSHPAKKDDIQLLSLNEVFLRSSFNQFMFGGINAPDADVFGWAQTSHPKSKCKRREMAEESTKKLYLNVSLYDHTVFMASSTPACGMVAGSVCTNCSTSNVPANLAVDGPIVLAHELDIILGSTMVAS
jgi:hypothetical protein